MIALYVRTSIDFPDAAAQLRELEEAAQDLGLTPGATYVDTADRRPSLAQLLRDVRAGDHAILITPSPASPAASATSASSSSSSERPASSRWPRASTATPAAAASALNTSSTSPASTARSPARPPAPLTPELAPKASASGDHRP